MSMCQTEGTASYITTFYITLVINGAGLTWIEPKLLWAQRSNKTIT